MEAAGSARTVQTRVCPYVHDAIDAVYGVDSCPVDQLPKTCTCAKPLTYAAEVTFDTEFAVTAFAAERKRQDGNETWWADIAPDDGESLFYFGNKYGFRLVPPMEKYMDATRFAKLTAELWIKAEYFSRARDVEYLDFLERKTGLMWKMKEHAWFLDSRLVWTTKSESDSYTLAYRRVIRTVDRLRFRRKTANT